MPADPTRTTKARRSLGAELARLRSVADKSIRQLGRWGVPDGGTPPIPHARIARIEAGDALPTARQLEHWLDATDAGDAVRERLFALREEALAENSSWADMLAEPAGGHLQRLAAEREQVATSVDVFCHQWLPGLAQTSAYAYALFSMLARNGYPMNVPVASDQRMRRQEILHEPGRAFRFLLTPRALAWNPDPATVSMTAQHDRLRDLDGLPAVGVRVLPDDADTVAGWSSFTLYDSDRPLVAIELEHRTVRALDEQDVDRYRRRFEEMWKAAVAL